MNLFSKKPETVKFGMWGPPGSGKTTYITMLQNADDIWNIKPRGEETQELFIEYTELLRDKKEFVPPTTVNNVSYLIFDFEGPKEFLKNKNFRVVIPEASGEYYEKPKERPELLQEMYRYHGIIWLIDPERIAREREGNTSGPRYRRMIQEWLFRLHEMQGGGTLNQYMAFCCTKMDLPQFSDEIDNPREFCLEMLGPDVERLLGMYCDVTRVEFFTTSSIGFKKVNSDNTIENKTSTRDPNDPTKLISISDPVNLFEPFRWLFRQF